MAVSNELMLAILSLDSHNRGYDSGMTDLGEAGPKYHTAELMP